MFYEVVNLMLTHTCVLLVLVLVALEYELSASHLLSRHCYCLSLSARLCAFDVELYCHPNHAPKGGRAAAYQRDALQDSTGSWG
jgi:hypothetical protein